MIELYRKDDPKVVKLGSLKNERGMENNIDIPFQNGGIFVGCKNYALYDEEIKNNIENIVGINNIQYIDEDEFITKEPLSQNLKIDGYTIK